MEKYGNLETMEPWHFMEMASFGDFIAFYKYLFFDSSVRSIIKGGKETRQDFSVAKEIKKLLFPAKTLRNAAAHNDCLLNTLNKRMKKPIRPIRDFLVCSVGLTEELVDRSWKVCVIHDFAALLICYDKVVPCGETRERAVSGLRYATEILARNSAYYVSQEDVANSLKLLEGLVAHFVLRWERAAAKAS